MENEKLTIWQRLSKGFGPNSLLGQESPTFKFDKKVLLKTPNKQEYEREKLQAQQTAYLTYQWGKIENNLYTQSVYYEPTRLASYYDYESMEFTPEISAALDTFSEESTTPNQDGQMLQIYSESKRIKSILTDLFYNQLDINTNLPMWTRNTCKYGDNFVFLKLDPEKGIVGCFQLPNIEIERIEKGMVKRPGGTPNSEPEIKQMKFSWKQKDLDFNTWEVAHFRLLGDDRKLPYGTSMLEKARRIWKQLILAEDAMLIYRTSRAPERRVFKVFVGNMDDKDVEAYVQRFANKFKRDQVADPKTGNVDLRYNQMAVDQDYFVPVRDISSPNPIDTLPGACIDLNTRIPLLDGRTLTLQEIINEWDNGNRNLWVYSCDPNTGSVHPGMVTWAGVTRKDAEVIKVTLDNGEEVITTPDHKFVHRTRGFVEAKDLIVGDSLMPFYRKNDFILNKKYAKKYEKIWNNDTQKWEFTHRMVSSFFSDKSPLSVFTFDSEFLNSEKNTIHHVDNNRFNNNPTNLVYMNSKDHYLYHRYELWSTPEKKEKNKVKISNGIKNYLNNLSSDELQKRHERINNPVSKAKTTKKLLEWNKNEENLKSKGKKISKAYTEERKNKIKQLNLINWLDDNYRNKVFSKKQTITFDDYIFNSFVSEFEKTLRADLTLKNLNSSFEFISHFKQINEEIRSSLTNLNEFTQNHVDKMVKQRGFKNFTEWKHFECKKRGFKNIRQWKYNVEREVYFNHKITKIEWLSERIDTGTITVDGNELYSKSHTFAIENGIFIKNSNLSEIADIEYIQTKLLTALRIPKAFLGFEEVVADGKNLALQDIRFARTINRIQKSMLAELNKIAIIHLFILGFEDELSNFTLGLTNPSTQADLLKVEVWKEKIVLYKDAVAGIEGIAPTSHSWAKKHILGFSDDEIKLDIQQQRIEKAVSKELENTPNVIVKTGIFDTIDAIYGQKGGGAQAGAPPQEPTSDMTMPETSPASSPSITPPEAPESVPTETPTTVPESKQERVNILLEGGLLNEDEEIDLSKARVHLGEMEEQLNKLLKS